jgi:hypothetical protein
MGMGAAVQKVDADAVAFCSEYRVNCDTKILITVMIFNDW